MIRVSFESFLVPRLRDKLMKEKILELKKSFETIQNTYEKKNKKNTIPEALITTKKKQIIKEKPTQRMEKFGARPKTRTTANVPCRFFIGAQYTNAQHWNQTATTAERRETLQTKNKE